MDAGAAAPGAAGAVGVGGAGRSGLYCLATGRPVGSRVAAVQRGHVHCPRRTAALAAHELAGLALLQLFAQNCCASHTRRAQLLVLPTTSQPACPSRIANPACRPRSSCMHGAAVPATLNARSSTCLFCLPPQPAGPSPFAIPARRPRSRCLAWSCCASWTRPPPPTSSPPSSASPPPSGAASWHPSSARVGRGWCGLGSRLRWLDPWKKLAAAW